MNLRQDLLKRSIFPSLHLSALLTFLLSVLCFTQAHATQVEINGPPNSGAFGTQAVALPNGNIVVTDPGFDEGGVTNIGAVYLYDGATLALISTLKGSTANDQVGGLVTVLKNGNFVVAHSLWDNGAVTNAGAITFCRATTGCNGVVSAGNSLVGSSVNDALGHVLVLSNGNYIVQNIDWDTYFPPIKKNVGAVTFCNGTTGCTGAITTQNSLIGSGADDLISKGGITLLKDGDYVVNSPYWHNGPFQDAGAVTFCRGTTGCGGVVSSANSLVGERRNEVIGSILGTVNGVVELANGNYVVASAFYNPNSINNPNPYGAVTLCNGTTGCTGTVWSNISLIGSGNAQSVGSHGVTALPNGNYVVSSPYWDNGFGTDTGAVTFCNGTTGCANGIFAGNSLLGTKSFDHVGNMGPPGSTTNVNPVIVLSDGNYVVGSPNWDNGTTVDVGAVTWCSATTGCAGQVSPSNSLTGASQNDRIGYIGGFTRGIYALKNGNYVVNSPTWDNQLLVATNAGAVTLCNGATNSCANQVVFFDNSLVGTTTNDGLGNGGTTALPNGNYVVASGFWHNGGADVGALTFCNGTSGCVGPASASNSLIGSKAGDFSIGGFVTVFPNGNYAVLNQKWDNGATTDAGAVTFCDGTTGCAGSISASNSLVGTRASDFVGSSGITILLSGNYVVGSPNWDNGATADAGAVTFCDGSGGCAGPVNSSNSLVGSTANDRVGTISRLLNGNYMIASQSWDNGATTDAGAVTLCDGFSGTVGAITSDNSVLGTVANSGSMLFSYDAARNRLVVGRRASNVVSLFSFETTALTDGNLSNGATWSNGLPNALTNIIIPTGRTVTLDTAATIGGLSVAGGANLVMNADLNLTGSLALGTPINTGAHRLALSCTSDAAGAPPNYVVGDLQKNFCAEGAFSFPTGTPSGYSPVDVTVTALGSFPSSLTVKTNQGNRAGMNSAQSAQRYWTLTGTGDLTANLTFNYLDGDVVGDEATYKLYKWDGMVGTLIPSVLNTAENRISANGISDFSDWAIGNPGSSPPPPADGDGDGVADDADNCPAVANANQADTDGDAQGDACDMDDDNDGTSDADEVAAGSDPLNANSTPEVCDGVDNDLNDGADEGFPNTDGDGQANCVDSDDDNDGQSDANELACGSDPLNANSKATDTDGDNRPDCVDPDDDDDGVPDVKDNCPLAANPNQEDADGDHIGDACDSDSQGDIRIVFTSNRDGNFEIYGMGADGSDVVRLTNNAADDLDPALSPDRSKIVFTSNRDGNYELYLMNIDGTDLARLTNNSETDEHPAWSPKRNKIVFTSERDGNPELYWVNADGTDLTRLTTNPAADTRPSWGPDGKIAFNSNRDGNFEIYSMNADGTGLTRLTNHGAEDTSPTWSPDGSKIAFSSNRNVNLEIYSMNADGTGLVRLTTNPAADAEPAWGSNGKIAFASKRSGNMEIYSMNADGTGPMRLTTNSALDISPHW